MTVKVWTDVTLLTMSENGTPYGMIKDGAIIARNGMIDWVGKAAALPEITDNARIISCGGKYMTPGLIDCHTHLIYGGNRIDEFEKRLQGASYEDIARGGGGILSTVKATRAADEKSLILSAKKRLRHLQKGGVTTVEIKSGYGLDLETELKMLRAARNIGQDSAIDVVTSFLGAHALPPEFSDDADGYMDYVTDKMLEAVMAENLADSVDAFCENIAFSTDQVERLFTRAQELNLPIKLHAAQVSNSGGAKLAAKYNALSADHLECLDEDGAKAMAAAGMVAVLLPGAFYTLRDNRIPPIDIFRKYKIPMAIASDSNPGSSPVLSLSLMINMASTLFHLTPEESLIGVTRGAAMALGLDDRGILDIGKKADFAIWNISHPAQLAYQLGGNACAGIVKNGESVKF